MASEKAHAPTETDLRRRIRGWTWFFIFGLIFSGATALPIPTAFEVAGRVMGRDLSAGGLVPASFSLWLQSVRDGIERAEQTAPFMFYGTDWLAFGHFVIAAAFIGAHKDPVRNRWLYQFGMMASAAAWSRLAKIASRTPDAETRVRRAGTSVTAESRRWRAPRSRPVR